MADSGIKISKDGKDATKAIGTDLLMTIDYPLAKLDITKDVSFRNINLTFATDPPEPTGAGETKTSLVYRFPHGYTYTPSNWCLVQEVVPPTGTALYQAYFQDSGLVAAHTAFDDAIFYCTVDTTYVNFYIDKYYETAFGGLPNDLRGMLLKIRVYVFVEDIGA